MLDKKQLFQEIDELYPEVVRIRRELHETPELSGQEEHTRQYLCSLLDREQIAYRVLPSGGVVAVIGSADTSLGIRADMDALPVEELTGLPYASKTPGCMHACGHDVHMAATFGAAMYFKRHEKELPQAVTLLFQPNEEGTGGADDMVKEGALQNPTVTKVIGFHVDPIKPTGQVTLRAGAINAALYDFKITISGKSCHGAMPHQGIDATVAGSYIVTTLQTAVSRSFAATTPVVVTIGSFHSGSAPNVVSGEAILTGTMRAMNQEDLDRLRDRVETITKDVAAAHGVTVEFEYMVYFPALINDEAITNQIEALTKEYFGDDMAVRMPSPSMGGDDFAFFSKEVPGCYFNVGTRSADQGDEQRLHGSKFAPDEESMKTAMALLCLGAFSL
ncbi:MAG: amidohydrolase [Lachnospiraceae bacterium]|nr:amidohydrolase [Lachnospiraceae bacterium]